MTAIIFLGIAIASYLLTSCILPPIERMLTEAGFVRPNFQKEQIPLGVGLVFFLSPFVILAGAKLFNLVGIDIYMYIFALGAMGLFGLIDDVFGTRGASGLVGHFKKLFLRHELTTGALKAIAGILVALLISLEISAGSGVYRWLGVFLNILVMALSTNAINLLDLRPGRAGKGFLVLALFVLIVGARDPQLLYLSAVMGSLIAFLPSDLKAAAMMGDTGSNMLGITLGYTAVFVLDQPVKIGYLVFLVGFHLLTEKYSLTKIIEKNKLLNYIDMMGRRESR